MHFDPVNRTKKHEKQNWKRTAMIMLNDDTVNFYQWLIEKRYPFIQGVQAINKWINQPLRGPHVTIINDMIGRDLTEEGFKKAKEKYDNTEVYFFYNVEDGLRHSGEHIYYKVECPMGDEIRRYAGLGDPYFGFHLTIGMVPEESVVKKEHSDYIRELMLKYQ